MKRRSLKPGEHRPLQPLQRSDTGRVLIFIREEDENGYSLMYYLMRLATMLGLSSRPSPNGRSGYNRLDRCGGFVAARLCMKAVRTIGGIIVL